MYLRSLTWEVSPVHDFPVCWRVEAVIITRREVDHTVEKGCAVAVRLHDVGVIVVEDGAFDWSTQRIICGYWMRAVVRRWSQEVLHRVLDALHLLQMTRLHTTKV